MAKSKKERRRRARAFFVYSSHELSQGATIERAIHSINNSKSDIIAESWSKAEKSSTKLIANILEHIDRCDILAANLTGLNSNVLFEVGYALGKGKRLCLFTQGHSEEEFRSDLSKLDILAGFEILKFENASQVANGLRTRWESSAEPELYTLPAAVARGADGVLLLKGLTDSEIAIEVERTCRELFSGVTVDDWTEDRQQGLWWYYQKILAAVTVVAILVAEGWNSAKEINARFSFVAGLALALGRRILLLGFPGHIPAADYNDWLKQPDTPDDVVHFLHSFASETGTAVQGQTVPLSSKIHRAATGKESPSKVDKELVMLDIALEGVGDTIAENEESDLIEYFVQTAEFEEAKSGKKTIFVGAKGSGKTANYIFLSHELMHNKRYLTCGIKPPDYKMSRFLAALRRLSDTRTSVPHVSETAWKVIIHCALASSLSDNILTRPPQTGRTADEESLLAFVEAHRDLIGAPFERKLDEAARWLEDAQFNDDNFSKVAHDRFLSESTKTMMPLLRSFQRIFILVDNLDKAWERDADLELQANMVYALFGAGKRLEDDIRRRSSVSLVLFLRRNIYEFVYASAREQDKLGLQTSELIWSHEAFREVIQRRIDVACLRNGTQSIRAWEDIFSPTADGVPVSQWIWERILARPRDLIHFVRKALEVAINSGHDEVQASDLHVALKEYSGFALSQVISEYLAETPWLQPMVSSLVGEAGAFSLDQLERMLRKTNKLVRSGVSERDMATRLVQVGFLGIRTDDNEVQYAYKFGDSMTLQDKVRYEARPRALQLVVHPVFKAHLHLKEARPGWLQRSGSVFLRRGIRSE